LDDLFFFQFVLLLGYVAFAFLWQIRDKERISILASSTVAVALLGLSAWQIGDEIRGARLLARNFYSSLRVVDTADGDEPLRRLEHGGIEHGSQYLSPARRREPISFPVRDYGVVSLADPCCDLVPIPFSRFGPSRLEGSHLSRRLQDDHCARCFANKGDGNVKLSIVPLKGIGSGTADSRHRARFCAVLLA
jgi:hypothetical protein